MKKDKTYLATMRAKMRGVVWTFLGSVLVHSFVPAVYYLFTSRTGPKTMHDGYTHLIP